MAEKDGGGGFPFVCLFKKKKKKKKKIAPQKIPWNFPEARAGSILCMFF